MLPNAIIIFGCLAMLILGIGIILFVVAYQKKVLANQNQLQLAENKFQVQLIEATLLTEQEEREKIAKNLHDDLGSSLNIIRLNMRKIVSNNQNAKLIKKVSENSLEMLNHSINDLRSIARDLMPSTLIDLGFAKSINELCKCINSTGSTSIEFKVIEFNKKIEDKTEIQLYRICQEVINNLLKHGKPTKIFMELSYDTNICIIFKHNGVGISDEAIHKIYALNKGVGLKSIESRIRMINGKISYIQNSENESRIQITAKG